MPNILLVEYAGEGESDGRFLGPIIERTLESILLTSNQQIDVYPPEWCGSAKGVDQIVATYRDAQRRGAYLLILHADADSSNYKKALNERLRPALETIDTLDLEDAPIVVPVIPVQETEAWMLVDREVLKQVLNTTIDTQDLDLHGDPERYADPKSKLNEVLRVVNNDRSDNLKMHISSLYEQLGRAVPLESLNRLPSYQRFCRALTQALREVGYLST
ncbi:hypothetical protein LEM8419_00752 [Neolewinella maritima]|uniref:DUF4276 family protein n=1 Tax=Neolewinella maritima TaxID=1383882 RepID=A0ABN8EZT9_9BACT|nr:DUF4276 family protein [Neolewinella maritima]CAH0999452.1 hypothetical protein LEM8419_00752 [Neolewinella maritima]